MHLKTWFPFQDFKKGSKDKMHERNGKGMFTYPTSKSRKRFQVFALESSAEEWTESLGTSAKTNSFRSDSNQETDENQKILGTTLFWLYITCPLKLAATQDCSFSGCFNVTLVVQSSKRWAHEKIWTILLVHITLAKKQQDTGDLSASVFLGACQWRLTKPQH